jgi:hypothetical protein
MNALQNDNENHHLAQQFLSRHSAGVIARIFAGNEGYLPKAIAAATTLANTLLPLPGGNKPLLKRLDFVIPTTNPEYADHDFGGTFDALHETFRGEKRVRIIQTDTEIFCGCLNEGMVSQLGDGIKQSFIISPEASAYGSIDNMEAMLASMQRGALIAGLAIDELQPSILAGQIANTFSLVNNEDILLAGGWDKRSAQRKNSDPLRVFLKGFDVNGKEVFYPLHGVEEPLTLLAMAKRVGMKKFIAPIMPTEGFWRQPDPIQEPDLYERSQKKLGTKEPRKNALLAMDGSFTLEIFKSLVMNEYRHPSVFGK